MQLLRSILDPQLQMKPYNSISKDFTNSVIHATGEDPTSETCQVASILFIRQLFNKEIKNQVTGTKEHQDPKTYHHPHSRSRNQT